MTTFALTDEHARMGKISNNLEKHGDDDLITGFTLPLELSIPRPQLVGLMGVWFDRSVWVQETDLSGNTSLIPADWLRRVLPIELAGEVYVGVAAALVLADTELAFEDCRVTHVTLLAFAPGGITRVGCHLYLRPGIGDNNLLLQEYQGQEIAVQLTSGKLRVKADKAQQQLPLEQPAPKTERELAVERGEEVAVITTVVDEVVTHEHPLFNGGKVTHGAQAACVVCTPTVGTPEEERERAHAREREIAQRLEHAHMNGDGPDDDDDDDDGDDEDGDDGEMSQPGQQIAAN